ncbi:hypothetical protein ACFP3U_01775 [Kitasatospora misakiensis]|uniref:Uncharacterized protein n=1 Tax=Kitasatospora misakiensis TaxID=67330 RepID=A0ABW0WXX8_9ACTN
MRTLNRLTDSLLSRVVPRAEAEASTTEYWCRRDITCGPSYPSAKSNQRRYCDSPGKNCTPWEHYSCCV